MSLIHLKSLLISPADVIAFEGKCHDCQKEMCVVVKNGNPLEVEGGAYWHINEKDYLKCCDCFAKNPMLTNYQPTEVYSRVCGYLRPVKQWNKGKQAEFGMRKEFHSDSWDKVLNLNEGTE